MHTYALWSTNVSIVCIFARKIALTSIVLGKRWRPTQASVQTAIVCAPSCTCTSPKIACVYSRCFVEPWSSVFAAHLEFTMPQTRTTTPGPRAFPVWGSSRRSGTGYIPRSLEHYKYLPCRTKLISYTSMQWRNLGFHNGGGPISAGHYIAIYSAHKERPNQVFLFLPIAKKHLFCQMEVMAHAMPPEFAGQCLRSYIAKLTFSAGEGQASGPFSSHIWGEMGIGGPFLRSCRGPEIWSS